MAAIRSSRAVPHPPERVFAFLADLHNHWQLDDAFIELGAVAGDGGRIRIRGPLGVSRDARTEVVEAIAPTHVRGRATVGRGTVGLVAWEIEPNPAGSVVTLSAEVERASLLDRLLLLLGGRRWLEARFARILERLAAAGV